MVQNVRDALRAKVFGQKKVLKIVALDDGLEVEVRQITVGQMIDATKIEDIKVRMAIMVIQSCFIPGTDEPLFEPEDQDALMEMPAGGYWQKLMDAANTMFLPAQIKAEEGN